MMSLQDSGGQHMALRPENTSDPRFKRWNNGTITQSVLSTVSHNMY